MPELKGQMDLLEAIKDELEGEPSAARAVKILDQAKELGWTENPFVSLVVRLTRSDALPFYARWDLGVSDAGKKSWRFAGARASNGQPLAYNDIRTYLEDPSVIYPEMPDELCEAAEHENPDQTLRDALGALRVISKPDPAYVNGPPDRVIPPAPEGIPLADWGALLS